MYWLGWDTNFPFYQGFLSQTLMTLRTPRKGGDHLPSTNKHSDIYLQRQQRLLIASHVITRLLVNEICRLGESPFD